MLTFIAILLILLFAVNIVSIVVFLHGKDEPVSTEYSAQETEYADDVPVVKMIK